MKFQIGDRVLILHSNEEGEVIDIMNEKMVMVDVRGVRFPAYVDQLDFPYFKRFSEKKLFPPKKEKRYIDDVRKEKPAPVKRVPDGVWLTFLPVFRTDEFGDEIVEELKIHLVNRTETVYKFDYRVVFSGRPGFELKNTVNPFEDFYLHDLPFENMNDNPAFLVEFCLAKPQKDKAEFYETSLKLKARQIFSKIEELQVANQATFSFRLFEHYPARPVEENFDFGSLTHRGYKVYDARHARQHLEPARSVIDLHIEKLTGDWKHLSNYEILSTQLRAFDKYYDLAVAHLQPSLTVIHGVGEGVLRDEIHERLHHRREVKSFVNQYHPQYGYGATEIFFQY